LLVHCPELFTEVIPDVGHLAHVDDPQAFAKAVLRGLAGANC
jgi:pimeloyl-ACP methyl ester carboxylesterase